MAARKASCHKPKTKKGGSRKLSPAQKARAERNFVKTEWQTYSRFLADRR